MSFRKIFLIVTGKTEADFREHTLPLRNQDIAELINTRLGFLFDLPNAHTLPVPTHLMIGGRQLAVPKNLGIEATVAQWWDLEDELKSLDLPEEGAPLFLVAPLLLSIFLTPNITGKPYDDIEQARAVLPLIESIPCTQALPVAAFFLSSYSSPIPCGIRYSVNRNSPMTTLRNWLKNLRRVFRHSTITSASAS